MYGKKINPKLHSFGNLMENHLTFMVMISFGEFCKAKNLYIIYHVVIFNILGISYLFFCWKCGKVYLSLEKIKKIKWEKREKSDILKNCI